MIAKTASSLPHSHTHKLESKLAFRWGVEIWKTGIHHKSNRHTLVNTPGLLFQTEAKYDSMVLAPVVAPQLATLYKNGKGESFKLSNSDNYLFFKTEDGKRFDATYADGSQNLYAVLTDELWSRGLIFSRVDDKWVSDVQKPEIIDTDYTVYLEFYKDSLDIVQAKIQSNKENRKLHFEIDSVRIDGREIDFDITNDRFSMSAEFNEKEDNLIFSYGNAGGKRAIPLTKVDPSGLRGYKPLPKETYTYSVPNPVDSFLATAALEDVGIKASMLDFMPKMNSGKYDHIHSIIITKDNKLVFEEYLIQYLLV